MPPLASYSSLLEGSIRIETSSNSAKHGNGALLVQNGCEFFGSADQVLKSSHISADFLIQSAKDLKGSCTNHLLLTGGQSTGVVATTGPLNLTASLGDASLSASANFNVNANLKSETIITTATSTSGGHNVVQSTGAGGNAVLESTNSEARVFGKTLSHLRGTDAVKVECTSGKIDLIGSTSVDAAAPIITSTATTKVDLSAPAINVVAATTAVVEAPTVDIGKAATNLNVNISNVGHATNVLGNFNVTGTSILTGDVTVNNNCVVNGNFTVIGTTTTITTENLLVKDNVVLLNDGATTVRDSGFLFNRLAGNDSTTFFWDESDNNFVFATTKSAHGAETFNVETFAGIKCSNIYASGEISMDSFATKSFNIPGNSSTPVYVTGINKLRGSYEFQIQSDEDGGSVYNYKVIKHKVTESTFASFGVHALGEDGTQIWVKWLAGFAPSFYHYHTSGSTAPIHYKVKFTTVL
jgi:hypothetical protein